MGSATSLRKPTMISMTTRLAAILQAVRVDREPLAKTLTSLVIRRRSQMR
jgi:hypothetical protein